MTYKKQYRRQFQSPGSALRRATFNNPRVHPCPNQCDFCARAEEGVC